MISFFRIIIKWYNYRFKRRLKDNCTNKADIEKFKMRKKKKVINEVSHYNFFEVLFLTWNEIRYNIDLFNKQCEFKD